MKLNKYHLSLAGEYRICSELLKRGLFATVTFGNMKGTDVVAVGPNRKAAIIEVKTSQSNRIVTGFYQKFKTPEHEHPTFWILHTIKPSDGFYEERFFVLSHEEMSRVQAERNHPGKKLTHVKHAELATKGVDNVLAKNVEAYEDAWDQIVAYCSSPT